MTVCSDPNAWVCILDATPIESGFYWVSRETRASMIHRLSYCQKSNTLYAPYMGPMCADGFFWYCEDLEEK